MTIPNLSAGQRKLLAKCSDTRFEFMKGAHAEHNAFDLFRAGLLERRSRMYSMSAGGRSIIYRWAYRRTPAGTARLREMASS